ncbi:MAG: hypothetical protein LQ348_001619, partial [Seirophora lacunosa]
YIKSNTASSSSLPTTIWTSPTHTDEPPDKKVFAEIEEMVDFVTKRWQQRCVVADRPKPSLEEFIRLNDDHLYHQHSGLARLIDRAEVRLVNQSLQLEQLHQTLQEIDLPNEQRLRPSWDQYFMQLASLAAQRSNCMKRRVGCVLVRDKRVISTGYNEPATRYSIIDFSCRLRQFLPREESNFVNSRP